jgi:hypothetical protein
MKTVVARFLTKTLLAIGHFAASSVLLLRVLSYQHLI